MYKIFQILVLSVCFLTNVHSSESIENSALICKEKDNKSRFGLYFKKNVVVMIMHNFVITKKIENKIEYEEINLLPKRVRHLYYSISREKISISTSIIDPKYSDEALSWLTGSAFMDRFSLDITSLEDRYDKKNNKLHYLFEHASCNNVSSYSEILKLQSNYYDSNKERIKVENNIKKKKYTDRLNERQI